MSLPIVTYLSVDSLMGGVGRSQVLPYVEGLVRRDVAVRLHSFETKAPDEAMVTRVAAAGVQWHPHPFGSEGALGGLARVIRGARAVASAELVHARSDLPAASAMLSGRRAWVWDVRAFWREERIGLGDLHPGSAQERTMRVIEGAAARSSRGVVTLSRQAIEGLCRRFGDGIRAKSRVITTCVDLKRFTFSAPPSADPVRFLLAGTLNRLYDVPAMVRFVRRMGRIRPSKLTVLGPEPAAWQHLFGGLEVRLASATAPEMPDWVREHHVGLCMRRPELGASSPAATPTKLGESLACGRPVVVSRGLGDMDELLRGHGCGVVVADTSDEGLDRAAGELEALLDDPATGGRCRALAEEHFDLERGVDALVDLYREVAR